jgi:uncharacterized protein (DUF433 family)
MSGEIDAKVQAIFDWLAEHPEHDVTFSLQRPIMAAGTYRKEVVVTDTGPEHSVRAVPDLGERLARVADRLGIEIKPLRPVVTTDPAVRFGRPAIRGISTEIIAGMVYAGEDPETVAEDYGLTLHEVLLACWHEGTYGTRARRRLWKAWVDAVRPALGGWVPLDLETVEWPPTRLDVNDATSSGAPSSRST